MEKIFSSYIVGEIALGDVALCKIAVDEISSYQCTVNMVLHL
jgi:hypothetical protein